MKLLRDWYRSLHEPEHVKKAPKRERWKRGLWQVLSTAFSFIAVAMPVAILDLSASWFPPTHEVGIIAAFLAIGAAMAVDIYLVFPWGVERFDLVTPWQFRDARAAEEGRR